VRFQVKSADLDRMRTRIRLVADRFPDRVARALYQEAQIEATEMKRRTPVDTRPDAPHPGNLRNSIHVEEPEHSGRRISVTIATGQQAPYAVYVHENPDAIHPIGQWKFMESVLNESARFMGYRLAARLHLDKESLF
jgi:hypothetical protein